MSLSGYLMVGAVVGFSMYYFMRQFASFNPAVLGALLIAAIFGPPVLKFIDVLGGNIAEYFVGLGIGFFVYAIYAVTVTILATRGFIERRDIELFLASRGPDDFEDIVIEDIAEAIEQYNKGKISKEELVAKARSVGPSKRQYEKIKKVSARRAKRNLKQSELVKEVVKEVEDLKLASELRPE
jgi:hypothetical protein